MEAWRQELYHHGIKGQKWGVRRGPPYPLGLRDHSASEKKAGGEKSIEAKQDVGHKRIKAVSNAVKQTRTYYTLSSIFNMQFSAPAVIAYAKIASDLHKELSANAGGFIKGSVKTPQQLEVLSKPNEPSELHETTKPLTAKFLATKITMLRTRLA